MSQREEKPDFVKYRFGNESALYIVLERVFVCLSVCCGRRISSEKKDTSLEFWEYFQENREIRHDKYN